MDDTNPTPVKLVLVTHSMSGRLGLKIKGRFATVSEAEARKQELITRCEKSGLGTPDYRICETREEMEKLWKEQDKVEAKNRKRGAERAAKTRAKNAAKGKKPEFILCPTCRAKSKKLCSEMGGLQTRVCQNGHRFEYDKWIADRVFWNPISVVNVYRKLP